MRNSPRVQPSVHGSPCHAPPAEDGAESRWIPSHLDLNSPIREEPHPVGWGGSPVGPGESSQGGAAAPQSVGMSGGDRVQLQDWFNGQLQRMAEREAEARQEMEAKHEQQAEDVQV